MSGQGWTEFTIDVGDGYEIHVVADTVLLARGGRVVVDPKDFRGVAEISRYASTEDAFYLWCHSLVRDLRTGKLVMNDTEPRYFVIEKATAWVEGPLTKSDFEQLRGDATSVAWQRPIRAMPILFWMLAIACGSLVLLPIGILVAAAFLWMKKPRPVA